MFQGTADSGHFLRQETLHQGQVSFTLPKFEHPHAFPFNGVELVLTPVVAKVFHFCV